MELICDEMSVWEVLASEGFIAIGEVKDDVTDVFSAFDVFDLLDQFASNFSKGEFSDAFVVKVTEDGGELRATVISREEVFINADG